ncbi:MAG: hypothetical protein QHH17_05725 [Candidatus Bathyarchaeota archaeon]|jgi:hypothetical protein|nr:hypothetical protein [Candidatus Bathyarchaeota archaeon]
MQIPIRMIGITTTFFWIFLIAFFVSAVYSVKDLRLDFGEPQMNVTADNKILLSLPLTIANKGFYSLRYFNLTTQISSAENFIAARGNTFIPIINKDEEATVTHNVTLDLNALLLHKENFLFNDTELEIFEMVGMVIADLIPIQAATNYSMPWGAPLYNFALEQPQYIAANSTHFLIRLPISFENHAFFDVTGNLKIKMFNNASSLLGEEQISINVPQQYFYNGFVEFYVSRNQATDDGYFNVSILTTLFNYENLVIPYGR